MFGISTVDRSQKASSLLWLIRYTDVNPVWTKYFSSQRSFCHSRPLNLRSSTLTSPWIHFLHQCRSIYLLFYTFLFTSLLNLHLNCFILIDTAGVCAHFSAFTVSVVSSYALVLFMDYCVYTEKHWSNFSVKATTVKQEYSCKLSTRDAISNASEALYVNVKFPFSDDEISRHPKASHTVIPYT